MDLKQDTATNDIKVLNGNVSWTSGVESIIQHLKIRLKTFKGEWFLDTALGVSYFDDVFKKNPDLTILNAVFTKIILDTPGVLSLQTLSFDLDSNRQLSIDFSAITADGIIDYSGFIGV
jgi:hypothetical protein